MERFAIILYILSLGEIYLFYLKLSEQQQIALDMIVVNLFFRN